MKRILNIILICILANSYAVNAQFGLKDRLLKKTQDKIEQKVEDKIVEELSEELARMAFKPIEKAMDDMLRSSYEESEGGEVDWEKSGAAYNDFLKGLNAAANVPEAYEFDWTVNAEIKDYEKEKHNISMLFPNSQAFMGMKQIENGTETLIVIDNKNNAMVMYSTNEDGEKMAQAIPSLNTIAGGLAANYEEDEEDKNLTFTKLNKQKKIAGYLSQGFEFESDTEKGEAWIAIDFPVNFFEIMAKGFSNMMPKTYNETVSGTQGMVMASEYENKDDKKIKSSFKVKEVKEEKTSIVNDEWGLTPKK